MDALATLIDGDRTVAGAEVKRRVLRCVGGLAALGSGEGDVVAIMMRNDIAFLEAMLIARQAGCYYCPINWHYKADEAGFILRDSGASALFIHADLLPQVAEAIPEHTRVIAVEPSAELRAGYGLAPERCRVPSGVLEWESWLAASPPFDGPPRPVRAAMPYSSGTTGRPKGIRRPQPTPEQVQRGIDIARAALGIVPGGRTVMVAPLYHSAPLSYAVLSLLCAELIVVHPRFDAERLLADIERYRINRLYLVPTHYVRLLRLPDEVKRRYDVSSVEFVASTGSPCPPAVKRAMIDWWGPVIYETYASSEAGYVTLCTPQDSLARPGTAGRALPGAELRILDEQGQALPPGEAGLIYCWQASYPDFTYNNNDEARRALERDGLICVGDVGFLDKDGYLFICDRKSDMVISGGVNIYPAEIESVLITLPGVTDCAVFGVPDAEYGEALAAHVQLADGAAMDSDAVRAFLKERIAGYKVPRMIEFARELPRDDNGKIAKRLLREPYWREAGRRI